MPEIHAAISLLGEAQQASEAGQKVGLQPLTGNLGNRDQARGTIDQYKIATNLYGQKQTDAKSLKDRNDQRTLQGARAKDKLPTRKTILTSPLGLVGDSAGGLKTALGS